MSETVSLTLEIVGRKELIERGQAAIYPKQVKKSLIRRLLAHLCAQKL